MAALGNRQTYRRTPKRVRSRLDNRIVQTLYAVVNQQIVPLHGFIKKTQKTPDDELELAKKRRRQCLQ